MALTEKDITELVDKIVYGAEDKYVTELTNALIDDFINGVWNSTDEVILGQLARLNADRINTILAANSEKISQEVMENVTKTLYEADQGDITALEAIYGANRINASLSAYYNEIIIQTSRGLAEVIARQNIALASQAEASWYRIAGNAITARNMGLKTMDKILAEAVDALSLAGIQYVDYKSGISNHIDVAIRRHVVTQTSQAGGEMTLSRLTAYGHDLVITSAHYGARPSHSVWQGKPCSLSGAKTIDGVSYPDFYAFTGYGTVIGLKGVNCRHSFGPYYPGITELPDLDFPLESKHFGMDSEKYYEATQRQRELERRIRQTKRDIANMERAGMGLSSPSYVQKRLVLNRQQTMIRNFTSENKLVRQYQREKAYGVESQPRALRSPAWSNKAKRVVLGQYDVIMKSENPSRFIDRSQIEKVHIFAGFGSKKELRVKDRLAATYGGTPDKWSHVSGDGWIFDPSDGKIRRAEVHWMEEESIGMVEFWFKRWRD